MDNTLSAIKQQIHEWIKLDYIIPEDIPAIELYMDQVTTFMDQQLGQNKRSEEDKILTKTMINNYTKNDILPPPVKKKYSKNHIILLIYIYYLKNFLPISDIKSLLIPMIDQYFESDGTTDISLLSIYSDIFELEKLETAFIEKSLYTAHRLADTKFHSKEEPYLHTLAYISILSYDIYAKKQLIETLIDSIKTDIGEPVKAPEASKKEKKKNGPKSTNQNN